MTALHFASDRGYLQIVEFLLSSSAEINAVDVTGQTALMYAVSCENKVGNLDAVLSYDCRFIKLFYFILSSI